MNPVFCKPFCGSCTYSPYVGNGLVRPKFFPEFNFIQFCNAHPLSVWRQFFCNHIHGNFCNEKVGTDSGCGCYSSRVKEIVDHFYRKFVGCHSVKLKVWSCINENFVNGIDMYVFRGNVLEVDSVDSAGIFYI